MVRAETTFALYALDERILEALDVSRGFPRFRIHEYRRVESVHILAVLHEHAPPDIFYVVLELNAQGPVIPRTCEAAVYLGALIDEPATFGERDYFVH